MSIRGALVIAAYASLACSPLAAQRFTLRGTVVDGSTNRTMPGVELSLQTGDAAVSDAEGRFAFGGLPAGEYNLVADVSGFGTIRYGEAPDPGWVSSIHLGGASGDKSVIFTIMPRGLIEGVIRDEFGDPMVGANVSIVRPVWRNGKTTVANAGQKSSDDRGRYRFGNLPPGKYQVCASGSQNSTAPMQGPVDFAARPASRAYTRTCGRTFSLAPGQQAQIDLSPTTSPTAILSGHYRNLPSQTGVGITLTTTDDGPLQGFGSSLDTAQATFTIRNVPPGHYRLRGNAGTLHADVPVDVSGSDISGIELTFDLTPSVNIAFHGLTENQIDSEKVNALFEAVDSGWATGGGRKSKEGTVVDGVPPGRYLLKISGPPDVCMQSVRWGDRELLGVPFDIAAGSSPQLDVTFSKNCGTIAARTGARGPGGAAGTVSSPAQRNASGSR